MVRWVDDGWIDGWTDRWMDRWMNGCTVDGWMILDGWKET